MLRSNANATSTGYCAQYVRWALEAGFGLKTDALKGKTPGSAKDYGHFLVNRGFLPVSTDYLIPQAGDIIVFNGFQGINKNHPDGHIEMYDGVDYISDFIQSGFWAGSDYRNGQPGFEIYRWNGAAPDQHPSYDINGIHP